MTRSATWWGGFTPPLERESVLSVYIPSSGDAIVELTAWSDKWGETDPPESPELTHSRASLDRGLAHTLAVWASQNVRPTPPRTTPPRWILIRMDGGTARYTVIAGLPEYGSLCVSGESDEFGQEFDATPVGRITSVLRNLSLDDISRHDAEARLRNLFITEWNW